MYKASFPTVIFSYQRVFQGFLLESQKLAHPAIQADPLPASSNSVPWFSHSNLPLLQEFSSQPCLATREEKKTCPLMTGPKWLGVRLAGWNRTLRIQMLEHEQNGLSNFCLVKKLETCHILILTHPPDSTNAITTWVWVPINGLQPRAVFLLHAWDIEAIRISWVYAVHVLIIDGSNIKYLTLLKLFWIYIFGSLPSLKAYLSFPKADSCFALLGTKVGCDVQAVDPSWKWICHLENRWPCFKKVINKINKINKYINKEVW